MRGSQALWTSKKKGQGGHQKQGTLFPALKIKVCCKVEREVGGGTGWGIHVNPWLIHFYV